MRSSNLRDIRKFFDCDLCANLSICEIDECGAALVAIMQLILKDMRKNVMKSATKPIVGKGCIPSKLKKVQKDCDIDSSPWIVPRPTGHQTTLDQRLFKTVPVQMDLALVRIACLKLVTVNGQPFEMIDDSGFRKVLNPLLQALSNNHTTTCIHAENIRGEVGTLASLGRNLWKTYLNST